MTRIADVVDLLRNADVSFTDGTPARDVHEMVVDAKNMLLDVIRETVTETAEDPVSHPSHYTYGRIECIDFIEDKDLNFSRGNAVKYIVRAGHKRNELEDLQKAKWYIEREIERVEKKEATILDSGIITNGRR